VSSSRPVPASAWERKILRIDRFRRETIRGLLVAVGLKTDRRPRAWCQAVEAVALEAGPAAIDLKFGLNGKTPSAFPEAPDRWTDAAQSSRSKTFSPPDDLFKILWPD